jgi:hypothetical protein
MITIPSPIKAALVAAIEKFKALGLKEKLVVLGLGAVPLALLMLGKKEVKPSSLAKQTVEQRVEAQKQQEVEAEIKENQRIGDELERKSSSAPLENLKVMDLESASAVRQVKYGQNFQVVALLNGLKGRAQINCTLKDSESNTLKLNTQVVEMEENKPTEVAFEGSFRPVLHKPGSWSIVVENPTGGSVKGNVELLEQTKEESSIIDEANEAVTATKTVFAKLWCYSKSKSGDAAYTMTYKMAASKEEPTVGKKADNEEEKRVSFKLTDEEYLLIATGKVEKVKDEQKVAESIKPVEMKNLLQIAGLQWQVLPRTVTENDRLNTVTYKADIGVSVKSARKFSEGQWGDWESIVQDETNSPMMEGIGASISIIKSALRGVLDNTTGIKVNGFKFKVQKRSGVWRVEDDLGNVFIDGTPTRYERLVFRGVALEPITKVELEKYTEQLGKEHLNAPKITTQQDLETLKSLE